MNTETTTTTTCGCCGSQTLPPTPGTNERGFYCETCGTAWTDPTKARLCYNHRKGGA